MKVDKEVARKCYENSLCTQRRTYNIAKVQAPTNESPETKLDPRILEDNRGPKPVGEVKEVEIYPGKKVKIRADLDARMEADLYQVLRSNLISFAWTASDMPGIDPNLICHRLNLNPRIKAKVQRRKSRSSYNESTKTTRSRSYQGNSIPRVAC